VDGLGWGDRDRVDGDLGREIQERRIRQVSTATAGLADSGAKCAE
jgi:hypothetical protein